MSTFPFLFLSFSTLFIYHFHSYTKILTLTYPQFPVFSPWFPAFPPLFPAFPSWFPAFPLFHLDSPQFHLDSLYSNNCHPNSLHFHHSPHSVSLFTVPAFKDSPIGQKKFLWLKKFKILCHGHALLMVLMVKKLMERFMKKSCKDKKSNQEKGG